MFWNTMINAYRFNWIVHTWRTKDGLDIPLKDMDESHLINAIAMIRRRIKEWDTDAVIVPLMFGPVVGVDAGLACLRALVDELDTRVCQIHLPDPDAPRDPDEKPTDCQIDEIGRYCAGLRHGHPPVPGPEDAAGRTR